MSGVCGPVSTWPPPTPDGFVRLLEASPGLRAAVRGFFERVVELAPAVVAYAEWVAVSRIPAPRDGDR